LQTEQRDTLLLHAYLDGELGVSESLDAERVISGSDRLAKEAAALRQLKANLHQKLPLESVSADFVARVTRHVGVSAPTQRPSWAALAASIVLAAGISSALTANFLYERRGDALYVESADSHIRALMAASVVDIASSERHVVKPWFNGKSNYAPKVPDLSAEGFPLLGGRLDVIQGVPVPALVYGRRQHKISVWLADASRGPAADGRSINGTNFVVWRSGDLAYWAASDLSPTELTTFAKAFADKP